MQVCNASRLSLKDCTQFITFKQCFVLHYTMQVKSKIFGILFVLWRQEYDNLLSPDFTVSKVKCLTWLFTEMYLQAVTWFQEALSSFHEAFGITSLCTLPLMLIIQVTWIEVFGGSESHGLSGTVGHQRHAQIRQPHFCVWDVNAATTCRGALDWWWDGHPKKFRASVSELSQGEIRVGVV